MTDDNGTFSATIHDTETSLQLAGGSQGISKDLQELAQAARCFADNSKASSTRRAYRSDWKKFSSWCCLAGLPGLPATPEVVATYITHLASSKKVATISRSLVAISQAHKLAGFTSPTSASVVLETFKGIRRSLGVAQTQKAPLLVDQIRACAQIPALGLTRSQGSGFDAARVFYGRKTLRVGGPRH